MVSRLNVDQLDLHSSYVATLRTSRQLRSHRHNESIPHATELAGRPECESTIKSARQGDRPDGPPTLSSGSSFEQARTKLTEVE
jgi:hypothetical protein